MDDLQSIVEEIGALADAMEKDRWKLCAAIAAAFEELPAYSRGLTIGLSARLKKSGDQIYSLRDSEILRSRLRYDTEIPPSHFSTLSRLRDRFNLTDEICIEWLDWVKETGASVREMSCEITIKYTEDGKKAFFRRVIRVQKDVQRLLEEAEAIRLPEQLRALTKSALAVLREWIEKLVEWRG
jgi:hypothetical protein